MADALTPPQQRAKQVEEWAEVTKALEEAMELLEANDDDIDDNLAMVEEFETHLGDCVARLNASERDVGIVPTAAEGLKFVQTAAPAASPTSPLTASPAAGSSSSTVCIMPHAAPYQVLFDGKRWYSCVIVATVPPANALERTRYRVWILGYNVEEVVLAEALRPWRLDLPEPIAAGQKVFAVHTTAGRFVEAEVDKLTPKNTVIVKYTPATAPAVTDSTNAEAPAEVSEAEAEVLEVPLSHVLNGKWYPQLRRIAQLSAADKRARARERKVKKKEKDAERRQMETREAFDAMAANQDILDL